MKRSLIGICCISLVAVAFHCNSVGHVSALKVGKPVSYTDLPFYTKHKFSRDEKVTYSLINSSASGKDLENILNEELKKVPNARGIKNLSVRIYSSAFTSYQFFNLVGGPYSLLMSVLGLTEKNLYVTGEIY